MLKKFFPMLLFGLILLFVIFPSTVLAGSCNVSNSPIANNTFNGTLTLNITLSNDYKAADLAKWSGWFDCGITHGQPDSIDVTGDYSLVVKKGINALTCEDDEGTHSLELYTKAGTKYCTAQYTITNAADHCNISIDPSDNLTLTHLPTKAHVTELTNGQYYFLYVDGKVTGNKLGTPNADPDIPGNLMTQGSHKISVRREKNPGNARDWTGDLCAQSFTIGTPSTPGGTTDDSGSSDSPVPPVQMPTCNSVDPQNGCPPQQNYNTCGPSGSKGIQTALGCLSTEPQALIADVIRLASLAGGGIAFILMIIGAFKMMISRGNPEALKDGQQQFLAAILGLVFIIFSVTLLQIIGVDILRLPGFS